MIGSTFIATNTPEALEALDLDDLERFEHISLRELITLDFETATRAIGIKWAQGQPVVFKEGEGIAIFQVNPKALQAVVSVDSTLRASHPEDIAALNQFLQQHGFESIYELATF